MQDCRISRWHITQSRSSSYVHKFDDCSRFSPGNYIQSALESLSKLVIKSTSTLMMQFNLFLIFCPVTLTQECDWLFINSNVLGAAYTHDSRTICGVKIGPHHFKFFIKSDASETRWNILLPPAVLLNTFCFVTSVCCIHGCVKGHVYFINLWCAPGKGYLCQKM